MGRTKNSLHITKIIPGKREDVFAAFTRKEKAQAYVPEGMKILSGEMVARPGGRFRVSMQNENEKDKEIHTAYGLYWEVVPNERLVFTHQWEVPHPVETVVAMTFKDKDGGTEITLVQEGFADPEEVKGHEEGWKSTLENQAKHFSRQNS